MEKEYYLREACGTLALALNKKTNCQIAMLVDNAQTDTWGKKELPLVAHVFCVDEEGRAMDIKGKRSIEDVKADYFDLEEPEVVYVSPKELKGKWMGDNLPLYKPTAKDIKEAMKVSI